MASSALIAAIESPTADLANDLASPLPIAKFPGPKGVPQKALLKILRSHCQQGLADKMVACMGKFKTAREVADELLRENPGADRAFVDKLVQRMDEDQQQTKGATVLISYSIGMRLCAIVCVVMYANRLAHDVRLRLKTTSTLMIGHVQVRLLWTPLCSPVCHSHPDPPLIFAGLDWLLVRQDGVWDGGRGSGAGAGGADRGDVLQV